MSSWSMSFHVIARHGYAIERLKRDMAAEKSDRRLAEFLAYDAANFVWGFLLSSGNIQDPKDRALRNDLDEGILATLKRHGITSRDFVVKP